MTNIDFKTLKIGDKVTDLRHELSPKITVKAIFTDGFIAGSYVINAIEDFNYFKISDLQKA